MIITYNNTTQPEDTISFTGYPNIIKIYEPNSGTYASLKITVDDLSKVLLGTEYTLVINDVKFVSTNEQSKAVGNKFFVSNIDTPQNRMTVAYSIMNAIRASSILPINYNIMIETDLWGGMIPILNITAKVVGEQFNLSCEGSLAANGVIDIITTYGTNSSSLLQGKNNKIVIDVYSVDTLSDKIGSTITTGSGINEAIASNTYKKGQYLTTLTKEYFGDTIYFDLQPLYNSLAEYGNMSEVNLYIYYSKDNDLKLLKWFRDIYFTTGYSVNQGYPFINKFTNLYLAQNVSRGVTKGFYNNTILYIYEPKIDLSLFATKDVNTVEVQIDYLNSAKEIFNTHIASLYTGYSLNNLTIYLNEDNFRSAYYVQITIPDVGTLRYNVIKPLKATDEMQRVYWTNSYGGTSFFDFTGFRSEVRKTKVDYYQANLFNFYDGDTAQLNKVYNKEIEITVSLSSHNIERDGQWLFFDLQNSKNAWTYVNNKKYYITVTDLKIQESEVNDIYVGTIEYVYSMADTF